MRLGVIGSRSFDNYSLLCVTLNQYLETTQKVVSGGARGADRMGVHWAQSNDIPYEEFLPDYEQYGKQAPFIRNKDIVNNSDLVVAFWDGKSAGTKHSLNYAKIRGVKSVVIRFTNVSTQDKGLNLWQL